MLRIGRRQDPAFPLAVDRARPVGGHDDAPCPGAEGPPGELPAVGVLPPEAEEEVAWLRLAGVSDGPRRVSRPSLSHDLGARGGREPLGAQPDHALVALARPVARGRRRSASPATSRSSKGIFRPPSNSCPCSWPLPAITTVSPGRATSSASAIAARRSGLTGTPSRFGTPSRI